MGKLDLKWIRTISILLVFSLLKTFSSMGCTTPVFRYALEMWPAFNYKVEIVYNGDLNGEQSLALNQLKKSLTVNGTLNLTVSESNNFEKYGISKDKNPQILLFHPMEQRNADIIWKGDLSKENVGKIIDSPARQEILHNIQKGDAISWVLVESSDKNKNADAFNTLDNELKILSNELKLATDATDVDGKLLDIEIINQGVHFSMLSVSRDAPAEEIFIKMLLSTEPDLPFIKAPMAFPVFGRGRVLFALVGKGINKKLIKETCNSVIGWCSCTIKEDNPGADLLFSADWEKIVGDSSWIEEVVLPEITGMAGFVPEEKVETPVKSESKEKAVPAESSINKKPAEKIVETKTQAVETQKEQSITVETVQKEKTISTKIAEAKMDGMNPLTRNILIVVVLLLVAMPAISFYLRKKKY